MRLRRAIRGRALRPLLLGVWGGLAGLACAYPLGVLAVPLLLSPLLSDLARGERRAWVGVFVWMLAYLMVALSWLIRAIYNPSIMPLGLAVAMVWGLLALHAALYACTYRVLLLLVHRVVNQGATCRDAAATPGVVGAAWLLGFTFFLVEIGRTVGPWPLPWAFLGYTQVGNPMMAGIFPLGGVYLVSLLTVVLSGHALSSLQQLKRPSQRLAPDRGQRRASTRHALVLLLGGAALWALGQVAWTRSAGDPVVVQVVHTALWSGAKYTDEAQSAAEDVLLNVSRSEGALFTLYPELFLVRPAFSHSRAWREAVLAGIQENRHPQIFGITDFLVDGSGVVSGRTNALNLLGEDGTVQRYHKQSLIPFAELQTDDPAVRWIAAWVRDYPLSNFVPGTFSGRQNFNIAGQEISPSICNEMADPLQVHRAGARAGMLINASSQSWIPSDTLDGLMMQAAIARALEAQKPMVMSGNVSASGRVSSSGQTVLSRDLLSRLSVEPRVGETPFARMIRFWATPSVVPRAQG